MITLAEKADFDQLKEIIAQLKISLAEKEHQISSLQMQVENLDRNKMDKVIGYGPITPTWGGVPPTWNGAIAKGQAVKTNH
jgi:hypothetical protein